MPNPQCAHCGGRMLITGDKAHGRITTCQMCGRDPTAHPPTHDYEKSDAEAFYDEQAAELRRLRDRQRYRAARAAH